MKTLVLLICIGLFTLPLAAIAEEDPLYKELSARSYPVDATASCLFNPWGERLEILKEIPENFSRRVVTAAQVYSDQKIRFDGYLGSDDDGSHYWAAADGIDAAYYGDEVNKTYKVVKDKVVDDLKERVWVCLDYPVHVLTLAGFPLREAIAADYVANTTEYLYNGRFPSNRPVDHRFYRRVENIQRYFRNQQFYCEDRITKEQYRDKNFRPEVPFHVGDIVFFGHYGDDDKRGIWSAKHSGIVASTDTRGLPVKIFNMRVSQKMYDDYDGIINHTRTIAGEKVFFKRFSDRYSLVGHGRIINAYIPPVIVVDTDAPENDQNNPSAAHPTPSAPVAAREITNATDTTRSP